MPAFIAFARRYYLSLARGILLFFRTGFCDSNISRELAVLDVKSPPWVVR